MGQRLGQGLGNDIGAGVVGRMADESALEGPRKARTVRRSVGENALKEAAERSEGELGLLRRD